MQKIDNISEKELKTYLNVIRHSLVCNQKTKRKILSDLKNDIWEYLSQNPQASLENIIDHFGKPESIVEDFVLSSEIDVFQKNKIRKTIKLSILSLVVAACVFAIALSVVIIFNNEHNAGYYYEETVDDLGTVE